ncbi:type IX secretion system outer membrane channel protein PorV [Dyadobacter sp. CY356]|uniref:type IX secretion system outer membrane channel protein PorV n=1 Tax=Dyadobacter sp. CY356 TaxID=2906442 RepID=UPI001F23E590|nr:type IX secretion system outer membrane channel protein PorV [Dyadobacter sp. CY356]MCF0054965.1 type IX secretion system outer membrane channel protein PorV [Dyadobacter sp. CY356]
MKKALLSTCLVFSLSGSGLLAQTSGPAVPYTPIPFLTFSPDARSSAMGEGGVALSPDANSTYWNAAKLTFADRDFGASLSYTPWLPKLTDDIWLGYASVYKKIGKGQAIAGSVNYYRSGGNSSSENPSDISLNATYSRQLGRNFSMGLTMKYISSNLAGQGLISGTVFETGRVIAADVSAFYRKQVINDPSGKNLTYTFGAVLSNLGGKIDYGPSYGNGFIPTTLKIGGGVSISPNVQHRFNFILDASKLMVPTTYSFYSTNQSALQGVIKSFSDAPGGLKEELQEVALSFGGEYWYKSAFALRGGYHTESKNKANKKYITLGAGFLILKNYGADFSYLIPVSEGSPFSETMRFTVSAYLGKN